MIFRLRSVRLPSVRLLAHTAMAVVAGLPAGVAAETLPGLPLSAAPSMWVTLGNDSWGPQLIDNRDDGRTAELTVGGGSGPWRVTVNASMLTDKPSQRRSDELTATVAYALWQDDLSAVQVAGGGRVAGDLGGASIQQRWHEAVGYAYDKLIYDPAEVHLDPLVGLTAYRDWRRSMWGVRGLAQGSVTGHGELQGLLGGHLLFVIPGVQWWGGPEYQVRGGASVGPVAEKIAAQERGLWLASGLHVGCLTASIGSTLHGDAVEGTLGYATPSVAQTAGLWKLTAEIGATITVPGLVQRLRAAKRDLPIEVRLDTRAGTVPGQNFEHDSVRYRQVSVGPGWAPRWGNNVVVVGPDVDAGIGWRVDGTVPEDSAAQLPELKRHGVTLTSSLGAAADVRLEPALQVGVSGSWDLSQPLANELHVGPAKVLSLMSGWSVRVSSTVSW